MLPMSLPLLLRFSLSLPLPAAALHSPLSHFHSFAISLHRRAPSPSSPQLRVCTHDDPHELVLEKKSKNQKKRDASRAVDWALQLSGFSASQLRQAIRWGDLLEEVFDAVTLVKRIGHDGKHARRRQLNLIGGMLRGVDPELMEAIIKATKDGNVNGLFPNLAESGDPVPSGGSLNKEETVKEEWQRERQKESEELQRLREREDKEEMEKTENYRKMSKRLENFSEDDVKKAKALVASIIKSGEDIEKRIVEAAEDDELTPLVLLVIQNRLELARHDDQRHVIQALSLLFRRIEAEMMKRSASPALCYLDELMSLYDGFRRDEWLRQCRQSMIKTFPPEDAFTVLAPPGFNLSSQTGPIDMPLDDDTVLLRVDFIREADGLLAEIEAQAKRNSVEGLDPQSVAIRLSQQQKEEAIELVRELRKLAIELKW